MNQLVLARCVFVVGGLVSCGKPSGGDASAPAAPKPFTVDVKPFSGPKVKVTVTAPASWQPTDNGLAVKDDLGVSVEGIAFDVNCDGECSPDKVPAAMAKIVEGAPVGASKPNYNTGDPALDAVRLDVATLAKGNFAGDGVFIEYTVKKPAHLDPKVDGPYPLRVKAVCARLTPAKDHYVIATAWAPVEAEKTMAGPILDACKSFTFTML